MNQPSTAKKPHIFKVGKDMWMCQSEFLYGTGSTPSAAYWALISKVGYMGDAWHQIFGGLKSGK